MTARELAAAEGLDVHYEVGDAGRLSCGEASFDVVASAQGTVFAPDHEAVAGELARVCRPGGRLGLTCWRPGGAIEMQRGQSILLIRRRLCRSH